MGNEWRIVGRGAEINRCGRLKEVFDEGWFFFTGWVRGCRGIF